MTKVLLARELLHLIYCKDSKVGADSSNELTISASPIVELLFQEFKDIFPKEIPHGLPPSRGLEHQIDLLRGALLPNRPTYKSNSQETQVKAQIAKKNEGYVKQANKNRKNLF